MTGRRAFLAALASAPWTARAATEPRRKRLAPLLSGSREEVLPRYAKTYIPALAEHGWVEGRTVELLPFFFNGPPETLAPLVRQMVEAGPDAIQARTTAHVLALQRATRKIPIVATVGDPVGSGFAKTLSRPGGNITGLSFGFAEGIAKLAEIAKLALPHLQAVSVIHRADTLRPVVFVDVTLAAFRALGVDATLHTVSSVDEVRAVYRALPKAGRGVAILLVESRQLMAAWQREAIALRVPTISNFSGIVEAGALLAYELYRVDEVQRTVAILDKVLRGADPATIPFELPDRSRLSVNLRTARAIGITLAPDFLLRADRVIE